MMKKIFASVEWFFLRPAWPTPLAAVRIGLSLVLLLQAWWLRFAVLEFFSRDGLLQGPIADYVASPFTPRLAMFSDALAPWGIAEPAALSIVAGLYVLSLAFLLVGYRTRLAAFAVWFLHWCFMSSGTATGYGADLYAHVFLFYLIFAPSGDALSLDLLRGRTSGAPSWQARLSLRVMQLQLAITYLMSAKDKSKGEQWWDGELIWRSVTVPPFRQLDLTWLAHWPLVLKIAGWSALALEGGYIAFIWPRRTRWFWIGGMMGLHAGIAVFMGLQLFGLLMCMLTLMVFGVPAERPVSLRAPARLGRAPAAPRPLPAEP